MARWTRRETLLALNLYLETPFGKQHKTYPPIVALAEILDRTPSSVGMKLCNFTSLDPIEHARGIKGLSGASQLDRDIWNEYHEQQDAIVLEMETLFEEIQSQNLQPKNGQAELPTDTEVASSANTQEVSESRQSSEHSTEPRETEFATTAVQRRYQNFFRRIVLNSYETKCCVTGNPVPELLRASHIVPWAVSKEERLNPRNGLCLSATFDAAFDRGLITFDAECRLMISDHLRYHISSEHVQTEFLSREGDQLRLPEKNQPDADLIKWHRENVF